ncbi:MAG: DMT family transporter [Salibacteraceae bacterium]
MKSKNILAHLAVFGANLIYGINYTVAKDVMPEFLTPNGFILVRVLGAVLMFWALSIGLRIHESIDKKDWLRLGLAGLFGVAINQLFFFQGLSLTTPINAAIIMTINPVMVLIIAAIILRNKITLTKTSGIALGLSGAVLLTIYKEGQWVIPNFSGDTALGDLLVLVNATSYAIYLVVVKPLMAKYKPITVVKWVFAFGLLYVLPFGLPEVINFNWSEFPGYIYGEIAFVVIGTTFFAYLFNMYGLKNLSPSVVSIYIYLQPFLATLFALAWGSDSLTLSQILSASLVFGGVYLVSKK